jgi:diguanylate cyclase (GGDEF)-like protein
VAACVSVAWPVRDACAKDVPGWLRQAESIFRPVAQDIDLPDVLIPGAIAEDARGFIWIGEQAGLHRWDGYDLKTYVPDPNHADAMRDVFIQSLHRDSRGTLWIGTVAGGLGRYDAAEERFRPVLTGSFTGDMRHIWAIDDDGAGGLWLGTGAGLRHLNAEATSVGRPFQDPATTSGLPDGAVLSVLRDTAGNLWVGTRTGLLRGTASNTRFLSVELPAPNGREAAVGHLMQDSAGRIWAGTQQHGAYLIDPGQMKGQPIAATAPQDQDSVATEITALLEVAPGQVWIGTYGRGIFEATGGDTLRGRWIHHRPDIPLSLPSDSVQALFRDRSGLVWVGTEGGLSQFTPDSQAVSTIFGDPVRKDGLTAENVMAVLAMPDGSLWAGSQGKGYDVLQGGGAVTGMLPGRRVFSLVASPQGGVLVGTDGGLYWADAKGHPSTVLEIPGHAGMEDVRVLRVLNGTIWLGGRDDGLWLLTMAPDGHLSLKRHFDGSLIGGGSVRAIELAPDGRVAVGADDGFSLIDPATGVVERVQSDPADPASLRAGRAVSFITDRSGRLWVGTDESGIDVLEGRDAHGHLTFRHIGVAEGLPNGDINKMLPDHAGRIWASTDNGLAVVDPMDLSVQALRRADGVAIKGYWSGAGDSTEDGALVFGGMGGITVVRPDAILPWRYRPPVVITGVRIGGKDADLQSSGRDHSALTLLVPPRTNSLGVEFAALDFSAPERNRYRYRLDGFDQNWIETDAGHRMARYTNLPPGDYTLRISGSNRDGLWAARETLLHIRVLPAWYQATWFRALAGGTLAALLFATAYAWSYIVRRRQRDLERQVAERTAELSASQKQLHQFAYFDSLTALQNRRAFIENFRKMLEEAAVAGRQFALVLVDLDNFKEVNDAFGHDTGDALLVQAAGRLRDAVREDDFLARLGGDEFAVLLSNVRDREMVERLCTRVVDALAAPMTVNGHSMQGGASVGVALFPDHGRTQEDLYRHVDQALYEAKRSGRGAWRWYDGRLRVTG